MNNKNRRGSNIEPWGTPAFIVTHSEFDPFKTTRWDRPERYLSNHTLNRFTLEKMYFSFIRPILEYGDVVWDTQTHYLINKIENVQSEAARIVTGGTKFYSIILWMMERSNLNRI
jgi:hypothetical protein